jgi:antitoxin MazE
MYMTTTTIQMWGNSYAVRLPKAAIDKLKLRAGHVVRVREGEGNSLSIEPISPSALDLKSLAASITPANRHESADWGQAKGNEVW